MRKSDQEKQLNKEIKAFDTQVKKEIREKGVHNVEFIFNHIISNPHLLPAKKFPAMKTSDFLDSYRLNIKHFKEGACS